jgi:hypothetical protein
MTTKQTDDEPNFTRMSRRLFLLSVTARHF